MFSNKPVSMRPGWRGAITLEVSTKPSDWSNGSMVAKAQLELVANNFIKFSRMWLTARGYAPVSFRAVNGYEKLAQHDWNITNEQKRIRQLILADYFSPQNWGKPMSQWKGVNGDPFIGNVLPKAYGNYSH